MTDAYEDLKVGTNVFLKHIMKMSPYNIFGVGGRWRRPKVLLWLAGCLSSNHVIGARVQFYLLSLTELGAFLHGLGAWEPCAQRETPTPPAPALSMHQ